MCEIGKKIKAAFLESGMSQAEFAEKLHTSRTNVYNIFKQNDPPISLLIRISEVLNHDFIADMLGYEKESMAEKPNFEFPEMEEKWYSLCEIRNALDRFCHRRLKDFHQRIDAYLSGKKRQAFYHVEIMTEDLETIDCSMALTDEDLQRVRQCVLHKDKEDFCSLAVAIDWFRYYDAENLGQVFDVTDVDFSPCYSYLFTAVSIETPESGATVHPFYLEMTDTEYSQLLLLLLLNPNLTVQQLETLSPVLYQLITRNVSCPDLGGSAPGMPYVIFMTEAKKDAAEIIRDSDVEGVPMADFARAFLGQKK